MDDIFPVIDRIRSGHGSLNMNELLPALDWTHPDPTLGYFGHASIGRIFVKILATLPLRQKSH
ncbi:MAG: hypothetical protein IPO90_01775 [Flavobacteriales bacterium]|nr:hypothetical protein [Flavobacteriales bacterium]MBL0045069.1 hypothetical protein [Flavobacteriales bacterium]